MAVGALPATRKAWPRFHDDDRDAFAARCLYRSNCPGPSDVAPLQPMRRGHSCAPILLHPFQDPERVPGNADFFLKGENADEMNEQTNKGQKKKADGMSAKGH